MLTSRALLLLAPLILRAAVVNAEPMEMVGPHAPGWSIHHAPDAPQTVKAAALTLQRCVQQATGAQFPIVTTAPAGPAIHLGANAASQRAGVDLQGVAPEGYRIVCRPHAIYILGQDTPDGQTTERGGFAAGTRNGVHGFLQDELGIRWVMPGPLGEEIPQRKTWSIDPSERISNPGFPNRRLPYIQNALPEVRIWEERMRLGYSLRLNHGHNWRATVPAELYDEHPDWFAMADGKRVPPVGRYKLETTNPQLLDYFAQRAVAALRQQPNLYTYSVSPSDSGGWSTSPESLALYETASTGAASITPLVLDFYVQVARRVKQQYPQGAVAGYIYANYVEPPNAGLPTLPDNLYLVLAPSFNYGYTLFRADTQARFARVLQQWTSASRQVGYYDLMNWVSQDMGAPAAPGLAILNQLFPRLRDAGVVSVYLYGQDAWGHGALSNYLLAQLLWNPSADPALLADEFCIAAYGPTAGPLMRQLYALLDDATAAYYRAHDDASYTLTPLMLKQIYGMNYARLEALYLQARAGATEARHQARLKMFEQNLVLLEWNLRQRGLVAPEATAALRSDDAQLQAMLAEPDNKLALGADALVMPTLEKAEKVAVRLQPGISANTPDNYLLRGPNLLLLYPQGDDEIVIEPSHVTQRGEMVRYRVFDSVGQMISNGVLANNQPIRFVGSAKQPCFMKLDARSASYQLQVRGAPWAVRVGVEKDHLGLHLLQRTTPLCLQVPAGVAEFTMTLSSAAPGETAAAELVSPSGKVAARFDTSTAPADRQTVRVDEPGSWTVRFVPPRQGQVDDIYLSFDAQISPWVSLDLRAPLQVTPVR